MSLGKFCTPIQTAINYLHLFICSIDITLQCIVYNEESLCTHLVYTCSITVIIAAATAGGAVLVIIIVVVVVCVVRLVT